MKISYRDIVKLKRKPVRWDTKVHPQLFILRIK